MHGNQWPYSLGHQADEQRGLQGMETTLARGYQTLQAADMTHACVVESVGVDAAAASAPGEDFTLT